MLIYRRVDSLEPNNYALNLCSQLTIRYYNWPGRWHRSNRSHTDNGSHLDGYQRTQSRQRGCLSYSANRAVMSLPDAVVHTVHGLAAEMSIPADDLVVELEVTEQELAQVKRDQIHPFPASAISHTHVKCDLFRAHGVPMRYITIKHREGHAIMDATNRAKVISTINHRIQPQQ